MILRKTNARIGPRDHGRKMSLHAFEFAKVEEGWLCELVIEVVSEVSRDRDYTEKRDEYWDLGIKEYWIVDAKLEQVLILRRGRSQWTEKKVGSLEFCETKLLPGFKLPCLTIFDAAGK